jgi:hypothetical protein
VEGAPHAGPLRFHAGTRAERDRFPKKSEPRYLGYCSFGLTARLQQHLLQVIAIFAVRDTRD